MRTEEKRKQKKKQFALVSVGVIFISLIVISIIYVYLFNGNLFGWANGNTSSSVGSSYINNDKPTQEQKDAGASIKDNSVNTNSGDKPNSSVSDSVPSPSPNPNGKSEVNITITSSSLSVNMSTYQVRNLISALVTSGTCTLTLTQADKVVTKTSGVQSLSSTSTCQGFDIPTTELSAGKWQVGLTFENNTLIGNTTTNIVIQ